MTRIRHGSIKYTAVINDRERTVEIRPLTPGRSCQTIQEAAAEAVQDLLGEGYQLQQESVKLGSEK